MPNKSRDERSREAGIVVARSAATTFEDPKNRGPNFNWSNFPEMAARRGRLQAWLAQLDPEVAEEAAREEATKLVAARGAR